MYRVNIHERMGPKAIGTVCLWLFAILLMAQPVLAGLVIKRMSRETLPNGQIEQEELTSWLQDNRVKTLSKDGDIVILDLAKGNIIMIDPARKEYSVTPLKKMISSVEQGIKQLREQFNALSPEQRAMVEKMMGIPKAGAGSSLKLKDTGKTGTIAGYPAHNYVILKDGKPVADYWVSGRLRDAILKEIDKSKMDAFEQAMNRIASQAMPFGSPETQEMLKIEKEIQKHGEILKKVQKLDTGGDRLSIVISVKAASIPASEFQVPADYKKIRNPAADMSGVFSGGHGAR